jgi:GntR family transcriptional regulator, transcriptional repressor for pyruvate dehydrogenase complex
MPRRHPASEVKSEAAAAGSPLGRLERAKRVSLSATVSESIVALISEGHIKPGERLPTEQELMDRLQVGRSSVREAIRGLALVGVVESRPRRGTIVVSPLPNSLGMDLKSAITTWALSDLFQVRAVLEEHAAETAARMATPDDIADIKRAAQAAELKIKAGASYFRENMEFHLSIARASHNMVLVHCLTSIIGTLRDMRERKAKVDRRIPVLDMQEHREIVVAIEARRSRQARVLMRDHIGRSITRLSGSREPGEPLPIERRVTANAHR